MELLRAIIFDAFWSAIPAVGFAMIFAVNGTHSLINGFNLNTNLQRGVVKEYLVAFVITIAFIVLIIAPYSAFITVRWC